MTRNTVISAICLTLFGCGQSTDKVDHTNSVDTPSKFVDSLVQTKTSLPDTTNQYIYDFMKVVIADQKLDLSYGLMGEPDQGCDISQDDEAFLKTLLIEKSKPGKDPGDGRNMPIRIDQFPKCLTNGDIDDMLLQKQKLSNFTWDHSRLGFSLSNDKNWYRFSRPLFSKDRKKAIMMIRDLCPGLCGTGRTVLFTKQNNKWTSQTGGQWMH